MRIAVVSDTHRLSNHIKLAKKLIKNADVLIHLGDVTDDLDELTDGFNGEVYAVRGNCDFSRKYPKEQLLVLGGKKIFITHGDTYGVKYGLTEIFFKAKEINADIVLFGHTHQRFIAEEEGILFMNPGSVSLPRYLGKSLGFIILEEGKKPELIIKDIK